MGSEYARWTARTAELRAAGASTEDLLATLRREGAPIIACVRALREVDGISLGEAKERVDDSGAWADRRNANEALRRVAMEALDEMARQEADAARRATGS